MPTKNAGVSTPARRQSVMGTADDPYLMISFVKTNTGRGGGRNWWSVPALEDSGTQWQLGDALGREAVQFIRRVEVPSGSFHTLLVATIGQMVKRGSFTETEMGFVRALSLTVGGRG